MAKTINITDAELLIMKVLWEQGELTVPEIRARMATGQNNLKTLLPKLVNKGAVKQEGENPRYNRYTALVSQDEYIAVTRKTFMEKAFDGSTQLMLLNFVKEEVITKEDLQKLMELVED